MAVPYRCILYHIPHIFGVMTVVHQEMHAPPHTHTTRQPFSVLLYKICLWRTLFAFSAFLQFCLPNYRVHQYRRNMCSFPFLFYFQPPLVLGLNNFLLKNHGNYNVRVNLPNHPITCTPYITPTCTCTHTYTCRNGTFASYM